MSRKKKQRARTRRPTTRTAPTTLPRRWAGAVMVLLLVALAGIWLAVRTGGAPVPRIDTSTLEPSTADLLHRYLDGAETNRHSGQAWGQLGGLLHSFAYKTEARVCLEEAARLEPNEPRWPYLLGSHRMNESPAEALAQLRRAVALCGNTPEAPRIRLAQVLMEAGETGAAREELEALLRASPGSGPALLLLGRILQDTDGWPAVEQLVQPCITNPCTAKAAWALLSQVRQRSGNATATDHARRAEAGSAPDARWPDPFEEEIRALRTDARSLLDRAEELLLAGNPDQAAGPIGILTREHPGESETWLLLGRMQLMKGQPAACEKTIRHFLTLQPDSVNGNFQLGMSLLHQSKFEEAIATFRHTTTLKQDFGPAHFNLGFALAKSGRKPESIEHFQAAILHNPERIDSYVLLGDIYLQLNQRSNAVEMARQAALVDPGDRRVAILRTKLERK